LIQVLLNGILPLKTKKLGFRNVSLVFTGRDVSPMPEKDSKKFWKSFFRPPCFGKSSGLNQCLTREGAWTCPHVDECFKEVYDKGEW